MSALVVMGYTFIAVMAILFLVVVGAVIAIDVRAAS